MSTPDKRGPCIRSSDLATHFGLFPFASAIRRRGGRPTRGRDCALCGRGRHLHYQFPIPSNTGELPLPLFTNCREGSFSETHGSKPRHQHTVLYRSEQYHPVLLLLSVGT